MSDSNLYTEILKSEPVPLTQEQLSNLRDNYAQMIVDDMDIKTLMIMAYDVIMENLNDYDEKQLKEEIVDLYGDEILEDLIS
jgi:hypothetical protein